jgi:hypothetical protein
MGFHNPFLEPCRFCDLVFDGMIKFDDFAVLALRWLDEGCSELNGWCDGADLTFDSMVDARDLAVMADCWLVQDITPPEPDPTLWETRPFMIGGTAQMIAKEAKDAWWGDNVEYYFDCVFGNCHDSGWQSMATASRHVTRSAMRPNGRSPASQVAQTPGRRRRRRPSGPSPLIRLSRSP